MALTLLSAGSPRAADVTLPRPQGYVTDDAGVIDHRTRDRLHELIAATERATSAEIAILTVTSTAPLDIFEFSIRVFDDWKIGKKGKNNGVLFVVAVTERRMRITVGYGLEAVLPDAELARLRDLVVAPYFREGRYAPGILAGTEAITLALARQSSSVGGSGQAASSRSEGMPVARWILLVVTALALVGLPMAVWMLRPSARDRRSWLVIAAVTWLGAIVLQATELTGVGRVVIGVMVAALACWLYWNRERLFGRRTASRRGTYTVDWTDGIGGDGRHATWHWSEGGFDGGTFGGFGGGETGGGGAEGGDS